MKDGETLDKEPDKERGDVTHHGGRGDEERGGQDGRPEEREEDGLDQIGVALGEVPLLALEEQVHGALGLGARGQAPLAEAAVGVEH